MKTKNKSKLLCYGAIVALLVGVSSWYYLNNYNKPVEKEKIKVGHLVGICMSPLFYADAAGYFEEEGLDVELIWMPNPGDSVSSLVGGSVDVIHNPFTNTYRIADEGANVRIIAGSGTGGLVCIAQGDCGLHKKEDLKKYANKDLKVGSQRVNTLELTFYRMLKNQNLSYNDYEMTYFTDHFSMLGAFQAKKVDVVTHVEPYATMLTDKHGGVRLGTSTDEDVWGEGSPDCVVSVTADFLNGNRSLLKKYVRAILRADAAIKADPEKAAELLGKYYKVDRDILAAAIPRQPPGVDLRSGVKGMEIALKDMRELNYLKKEHKNVVDLSILEEVIKDEKNK